MGGFAYKGREFKFDAPTPMAGCAIFNTMMSFRIPFVPDDYFGIGTSKNIMPPEELDRFMKMCLKNVHERIGDRDIPVMDAEGQVGIIDATGPMLAALTTQYIVFFGEHWLEESV